MSSAKQTPSLSDDANASHDTPTFWYGRRATTTPRARARAADAVPCRWYWRALHKSRGTRTDARRRHGSRPGAGTPCRRCATRDGARSATRRQCHGKRESLSRRRIPSRPSGRRSSRGRRTPRPAWAVQRRPVGCTRPEGSPLQRTRAAPPDRARHIAGLRRRGRFRAGTSGVGIGERRARWWRGRAVRVQRLTRRRHETWRRRRGRPLRRHWRRSLRRRAARPMKEWRHVAAPRE